MNPSLCIQPALLPFPQNQTLVKSGDHAVAEGFSVQTGALRTASEASREVGAGLVKPGNDAAAEGNACEAALVGFASAGALGVIARSWQGQVAYISEGYTQAADGLESNAVSYEQNEQTVVNMLLPQQS